MTDPGPRPKELSLELPAVHQAVRVARSVLARFARLQGLSSEDVSAMGLVASEMLANAIDHTSNGTGEVPMREEDLSSDVRMGLTLELSGQTWTLTVRDEGGGDATAVQAMLQGEAEFDPDDHRGRGLFLMRAMVDELAVAPSADGRGLSVRARKRYGAGG